MYFILPTAIVKIGRFVGLDENNNIDFSSDNKCYAFSKTVDNKLILIKFLTNKKEIVVDEEFLKDYLLRKAKTLIKDKDVVIYKSRLEEDPEFQNILGQKSLEFEEEISLTVKDKLELKKEIKKFEKEMLEEKANEILLEEKLISEGFFVRLPLSANDNLGTAKYNDEEYPIYESFCIMLTKEREPRKERSGLYNIINNRHSLPLIFERTKNQEKGYKLNVRLNTHLMDRSMLITFLNHSIRTANQTEKFLVKILLNKYNTKAQGNKELKDLVEKLANCTEPSTIKEYILTLEHILTFVKENETEGKLSYFSDSYIYLPLTVGKDYVYNEDSLIRKAGASFFNVSFRGLDREKQEEYIPKLDTLIEQFIENKKLYGAYSILYGLPYQESDTYGFLENNMHTSKLFLNFNDTIELYNLIYDTFKDEFIQKASDGEKKDGGKNFYGIKKDGSLEL